MERLYFFCALVGGTVFALQFLSTLLGMGGDHGLDGADHVDLDHGGGMDHGGGDAHEHDLAHDTSWFVGLLTFRTIVAGLAFFGCTGMAATASGAAPFPAFGIALAGGGVAVYAVAWLMRSLYRLRADGTVTVEQTVGQSGTVYLTVPGHHAGQGKVTVTLPDRTMEYLAVTSGEALPTGAPVVVRGVVGTDTVEVAAASGKELQIAD